MTIIFWGTLSNSRAPVDVTIFFSSTFIFGRFVDSDPVAIIILSVTFFGVLFFILVRNALRRKLDILIEEEKKRKSDNLD